MSVLAHAFYWDPPRFIFTIPYLDRPIGWYGLLFALGFVIGYFIMVRLYRREIILDNAFTPAHVKSWPALIERMEAARNDSNDPLHRVAQQLNLHGNHDEICDALRCAFNRERLSEMMPKIIYSVGDLSFSLTDKLCWFVVAGTVIGARLGHVFFYGWDYYRHHLNEIPKVWEGGLASHGGVLGVVLAVYLYQFLSRKVLPSLGLMKALDLIVIPSAMVAFCIRLGNFFNQEIIGKVTNVPWAVVFGHPAEGGAILARHPVQLYEGIFYLAFTFVLVKIWRSQLYREWPGLLCGLLFTVCFSWRFLMEFFKESQGGIGHQFALETGQLLSLPMVLFGLWLIWRGKPNGPGQAAQSAASAG